MKGADPALVRLARGEKPRVLDLFSGAGGISLGFQRAGFRIDGAVEIDPLPARTHARNFHQFPRWRETSRGRNRRN